MGDAMFLGCSAIYDLKKNDWIDCGINVPCVFISVELDESELQTMALAFVSGVSENKIIQNKMDFEEQERVDKAIDIIEASTVYFEYMPDYTMRDVENCIKRNIRIHNVSCVFK